MKRIFTRSLPLNMNPGVVHLNGKGHRRVGIRRPGRRPPIPQSIPDVLAPVSPTSNNMKLKADTVASNSKVQGWENDDGNICRRPESSEDESEKELLQRQEIVPSQFVLGSKDKDRAVVTKEKKISSATRAPNDSKTPERRKGFSSTQKSHPMSPKRKSQEDLPRTGDKFVDGYGFMKNTRTTKTYGSLVQTKSSQISSQRKGYGKDGSKPGSRALKPSSIPEITGEGSPERRFNPPEDLSDDSPQKSNRLKTFKLPHMSDTDPPISTPRSKRKFVANQLTPSPAKAKEDKMPAFINPNIDDLDEPRSKEASIVPEMRKQRRPEKNKGEKWAAFKNVDIDDLDEPVDTKPEKKRRCRPENKEPPPLTQLPAFRMHDDLDELAGTAHALLENGEFTLPPRFTTYSEDEDVDPQVNGARCPMCKQPVDLVDIKNFGGMNTRAQEKFCQSHQKKSAQEEWNSRGYPTIDWEGLGSRIEKHHSFIKNLISGADSHYRSLLQKTVKEGKDRNLLKASANLTPGYYGGRGLRVISENIMHDFTPLLKTKAIKDRLMSARGVTGFVQSVVVPEVTVLLIMEDMNVDMEGARDILTESVAVGELIHEEIKDVVQRRVEDSEDDDFDD